MKCYGLFVVVLPLLFHIACMPAHLLGWLPLLLLIKGLFHGLLSLRNPVLGEQPSIDSLAQCVISANHNISTVMTALREVIEPYLLQSL